jgi:hypothetical protein
MADVRLELSGSAHHTLKDVSPGMTNSAAAAFFGPRFDCNR